MRSRSVLSIFLLFFCVAGTTTFGAEAFDLAMLKRNTRIFEGIVNEVIKQNFPNPFAVTGRAEASYLQEFGIVVSLHLNINRAKIRTPFGMVTPLQDERSKEEQLRTLKDSMVRCLADYGGTFKQLTSGNFIAITAHVEDRNELDSTRNTIIVIISASKENVDALTMGRISPQQFQERVRITEY